MMHPSRCSIRHLIACLGLVLAGVGLSGAMALETAFAQPVVYSEDFNDGQAQGWQLDSSWQVSQNRLTARGRGWARYRNGNWENLKLSFLFNASNRGVVANIRVSDRGRYGVGFRPERGIVLVYLFKETPGSGPNAFRDLGQRRMPVRDARQGYRAEIFAQNDRISVSLNGNPALNARDRDPLPAGAIAFESFPEGTAFVDNVSVRGDRQWVAVPALIGKPVGEARDRLREGGLVLGQTRERPADAKPGLVIDQQPSEGERVAPGAAVQIVVSTGPQQVEVPRLLGLTRADALRVIKESGLTVGAVRQGDAARENAIVVEQDPKPGSRVSPGSAVSVTLEGKTLIEVPRVIGKPLKAAREILESFRLKLGEVVEKPSDAPEQTVLDQQPKAGTQAPPGSLVKLWVSTGAPPDLVDVTVPKLLGHTREEARSILDRAGLELGRVVEKASRAEPGTIIDQDPAPDVRTRPRTAVDLWVSVPESFVQVPGIVGRHREEAQSMLEAAGLRTGTVSEQNAAGREGTVLEQDPPGGSQAPRGTAVAIVVGRKRGDSGWPWLLPAALTGLLGLLAGYLGGRRFECRRKTERQPVEQITVRPVGDPGSQSMDVMSEGPEAPGLRCRAIPDTGEQRIEGPESKPGSDEDGHAG